MQILCIIKANVAFHKTFLKTLKLKSVKDYAVQDATKTQQRLIK